MFLITSLLVMVQLCTAVPPIPGLLEPVEATPKFLNAFFEIQTDVLARKYDSAAHRLRESGYIDGRTSTTLDNTVVYFERGQVRYAMQSLYNAMFCDEGLQIPPDYAALGVGDKLNRAMKPWLSGHVSDSESLLARIAAKYPGLGEANLARGMMVFASRPALAYTYWRMALQANEGPPGEEAPQNAAAELLVHFRAQ